MLIKTNFHQTGPKTTVKATHPLHLAAVPFWAILLVCTLLTATGPAYAEALGDELRDFVGRPTPPTPVRNLSAAWGAEIWLKREDLAHTGAHKINNAMGQALLARRMGKTRIIAETGAGQHGVATATVCAGAACSSAARARNA